MKIGEEQLIMRGGGLMLIARICAVKRGTVMYLEDNNLSRLTFHSELFIVRSKGQSLKRDAPILGPPPLCHLHALRHFRRRICINKSRTIARLLCRHLSRVYAREQYRLIN